MIKLPDDSAFELAFRDWHPNKTGPYVKQQMQFMWYAAIAEVQRINATAQPVSDGWVKCSEMMPEADGHYLVFANASTLDGYCDHNDIACYQDGKWSNEFNWLVTHWMPLPAAPGGQDD